MLLLFPQAHSGYYHYVPLHPALSGISFIALSLPIPPPPLIPAPICTYLVFPALYYQSLTSSSPPPPLSSAPLHPYLAFVLLSYQSLISPTPKPYLQPWGLHHYTLIWNFLHCITSSSFPFPLVLHHCILTLHCFTVLPIPHQSPPPPHLQHSVLHHYTLIWYFQHFITIPSPVPLHIVPHNLVLHHWYYNWHSPGICCMALQASESRILSKSFG